MTTKSCDCLTKRAVIVVGFKCVNDCQFCVIADKRAYGDKTSAEIKQEVKVAYASGAREIVFTGGECTVRDDIFELVAFAKNLSFKRIHLQTNGRSFSSMDFCKKILLAGMTVFNPALHGHTAKVHDGLTRAPGSFRQTVLGIYNIRRLGQGKVPILTNTVVTKKNYRYLPEIAKLLIGLRVEQYQFAFVHAQGHAGHYFKKIVPRKTDVLPYVKKAVDIGKKAGVRVMVEAVPYCLMKGYEKHVTEQYIPSTDLWDRGRRIKKFEDVRRNEAKMKFPQCRRCMHDAVCEGPWREYPEHYGNEEFQPIVSA